MVESDYRIVEGYEISNTYCSEIDTVAEHLFCARGVMIQFDDGPTADRVKRDLIAWTKDIGLEIGWIAPGVCLLVDTDNPGAILSF